MTRCMGEGKYFYIWEFLCLAIEWYSVRLMQASTSCFVTLELLYILHIMLVIDYYQALISRIYKWTIIPEVDVSKSLLWTMNRTIVNCFLSDLLNKILHLVTPSKTWSSLASKVLEEWQDYPKGIPFVPTTVVHWFDINKVPVYIALLSFYKSIIHNFWIAYK